VIVLGILAFLGLVVGTTLLRGIVFQQLWAWFIAPQFALPELPLAEAIGLSLVVTFLVYQYDARKDDRKTGFAESLVEAGLASLLLNGTFYLVGAIVASYL
jgi:hypothetical protein